MCFPRISNGEILIEYRPTGLRLTQCTIIFIFSQLKIPFLLFTLSQIVALTDDVL
jgi:hypothetical protein